MSVPMSLLAMLSERPMYGLQMKDEFERRTGGVWPLNVGQVYTTLARLERDGYVVMSENDDNHKTYTITDLGRARLDAWFTRPTRQVIPARDESVLKLILAIDHPDVDATDLIQVERKAALRRLQEYTRLKTDAGAEADLGWLMLIDSLIFKTESRVRWLDASEQRIARAAHATERPAPQTSVPTRSTPTSEASIS